MRFRWPWRRSPASLPVLEWTGDYPSWQQALADSKAYDSDEIFRKTLDATRKVVAGEAAYERDSYLFDHIAYTWSLLSALLLAHAQDGRLDVLDFGGSLGSSYRQNHKFLDRLAHVAWNVVEQAHVVEAGKAEFETERLRFRSSIAECGPVNVALFPSVLCYLEDPWEVLRQASATTARLLFVNRTPFHEGDQDRIRLQIVRPPIYDGSYPCWQFSRGRFEAFLERLGWRRLESWPSDFQPDPGCPHADFLFVRDPASQGAS